jgi:hypothetical protein
MPQLRSQSRYRTNLRQMIARLKIAAIVPAMKRRTLTAFVRRNEQRNHRVNPTFVNNARKPLRLRSLR